MGFSCSISIKIKTSPSRSSSKPLRVIPYRISIMSEEALRLVNDKRASHGCPDLKWDDELSHKATEWAQHLVNDIGHLEHSEGDQWPGVSTIYPACVLYVRTNTDEAIVMNVASRKSLLGLVIRWPREYLLRCDGQLAG